MADAAAAPRVAGELGGLCMICHDKPAAFGLVCRLSGGAAQWFVHAGVCGDCKGGPGGWGWNHCPFCRSDNPTVAKIVVTNPVDQAVSSLSRAPLLSLSLSLTVPVPAPARRPAGAAAGDHAVAGARHDGQAVQARVGADDGRRL